MSGDFGTYGLTPGLSSSPDTAKPLGSGANLLSLGAAQNRDGLQMMSSVAASEAKRNMENQQIDTQRKAGNAQLGSALGGAVAGAAFGPWGALAGGVLGAIAGYNT